MLGKSDVFKQASISRWVGLGCPGRPSDEEPLNEFQALVLAFQGKATKKTSNLGQSTTRPMPLHMPSDAEYDAKEKLGKAVN